MKNQKITIVTLVACLFISLSSFAQKEKKEKPSPQQRFEKMDKNKDGKITSDEIKEKQKAKFAKKDLNNDGEITLEEFLAKPAKKEKGKGKAKGKGKGKAKKAKKAADNDEYSGEYDEYDGEDN